MNRASQHTEDSITGEKEIILRIKRRSSSKYDYREFKEQSNIVNRMKEHIPSKVKEQKVNKEEHM